MRDEHPRGEMLRCSARRPACSYARAAPSAFADFAFGLQRWLVRVAARASIPFGRLASADDWHFLLNNLL